MFRLNGTSSHYETLDEINGCKDDIVSPHLRRQHMRKTFCLPDLSIPASSEKVPRAVNLEVEEMSNFTARPPQNVSKQNINRFVHTSAGVLWWVGEGAPRVRLSQ